jgi:putative ABC transport system permease protein
MAHQAGVGRQITLPWSRAFEISMRNVRLRLGRAAITAAGIFLGIAFLMSVWITTEAQKAIEAREREETQLSIQRGEAEAEHLAEAPEQRTAERARVIWLIVMSLLVSGVGITNSMLMSVTERFREIGTMKCLGALDSFVVRLFLIESSLLGFLGSVAGALVGGLLMLLVWCLKDSFAITSRIAWGNVALELLLTLVIGTVLTLLAAIPPAINAAKMPPAAALRTEI